MKKVRYFMRLSWMLVQGAILASAASTAIAQFEITRSTIDGGGAMNATGGSFELSGTIGQPDAGVLTGGSFELTGGFWFALDDGDCNDDGVVGLSDHDRFVSCLNGPAGALGAGCACYDIDGSGTVDLADFAFIQTGFHGD